MWAGTYFQDPLGGSPEGYAWTLTRVILGRAFNGTWGNQCLLGCRRLFRKGWGPGSSILPDLLPPGDFPLEEFMSPISC